MKIKLYILATLTGLMCVHTNAYGVGVIAACEPETICQSNCTIVINGHNCAHSSTTYYVASGIGLMGDRTEYGGVTSCDTCPSGATKTKKTFTLGTNCTATYYTCSCNCSTTSWAALRTGYESRTICNSNCTTTTEYRCAKGYYGTSTNGSSGCTACGSGATTASAGTTVKTGCYIPSGTSFTDSSGSGKYTSDCYWKN